MIFKVYVYLNILKFLDLLGDSLVYVYEILFYKFVIKNFFKSVFLDKDNGMLIEFI